MTAVVRTIRVAEQDRRAFFTPRTLAAYLAVSERTVRQMVADGRIPSYRIEGARRISAEDVDAYLARNRTGRA
jgi:excisionase family DNA binding protein